MRSPAHGRRGFLDASILIPTGILLMAAGMLLAGATTLRGIAAPSRGTATAARPPTVPVRVLCPQTAVLTRIRIRPEIRGSDLGLRVCECERFPDGVPMCDQECVEESAPLARGFVLSSG